MGGGFSYIVPAYKTKLMGLNKGHGQAFCTKLILRILVVWIKGIWIKVSISLKFYLTKVRRKVIPTLATLQIILI